MALVTVGVSVNVACTCCGRMEFGLAGFGKVPTAWFGIALATTARVGLQHQNAVALALTEGELLNSATV